MVEIQKSDKDEILRKAANSSDPLVAKITTESRQIPFDEELIAKDDLITDEVPPQPNLSGMGGTSGKFTSILSYQN